MMNCFCLLFFLILCNICRAYDPLTCEQSQTPLSKIIQSLSSSLVNEIGGDENFFFSPLSISVALAMIYIGAGGSTRNQMTEALGYKQLGKKCLNLKVGEKFRDLILSLEGENDAYSLLVANGIFIHLDYAVSKDYTSKLEQYFDANVESVDFANEGNLVVNKINQWVFNNTNGQIRKLINEPLDTMTIVVLMNAVYFKGLWKQPFQEKATWNSFFYKKDGTSKIVPFMLLQDNVMYYHDKKKNYYFLELDYAGGNVSMLVILPKSVRDFPALDLNSETLCSIRAQLQPQDVMVVLPKFSMVFKRELSKDMMKIGISELFSDRADLTGIREQNDLHVSLMVHKALIDVDERGSEASGASGVGIDGRRKNAEQATFWADHPFLFYIIDKSTETILFAGRVADP